VTDEENNRLIVKEKRGKADGMPLGSMARTALDEYLATLNGHKPCDLYEMVISEVERPLFEAVMEYTRGNQSRAAAVLGINRGTLRKKLRMYGLMD